MNPQARRRFTVLVAVGAFFGVATIGARAWRAERGRREPGATILSTSVAVPRAKGAIRIDGEVDEPAWEAPTARTGAFNGADGQPSRVYSDARLLWDSTYLYVALYAGDEDLQVAAGPMRDSFHVDLGRASFDVGVDGVATGAPIGTRVAVDRDGTVDAPADDDEEWLVEMAIPLASLGLRGAANERVHFAVRRCDTPHSGRPSCGQWGTDASDLILHAFP